MLVLASQSPRRAELLSAARFDFVVRVADIDETLRPGELPEQYSLRLAREKAAAVHASAEDSVLGADTIVLLNGEVMGKPRDASDAARMLAALSGQRHEVITGVCLRRGARLLTEAVTTAVWFSPLSEAEIAWYVASGEPMDKAGAYAIQGLASRFIERIDGSYSNVVGLPVSVVYRMLGTL
ncbi:MAG: maf protein [Bryobacterales bacterium]|nr:maf protein [Bryobacterales bacterium]